MIAVAGLALGAGGCVSTAEQAMSYSCADFIGRPISERIAALGPPRSVYRITPTEVGYIFETKDAVLVGGETYYTVNYMTGADKHHTPIRTLTTKCRGFVVRTPSPTTPASERIIIDTL
jgi:hypothetical protein